MPDETPPHAPAGDPLAPLYGVDGVDATAGVGNVGGDVAGYLRLLGVFVAAHQGDAARLSGQSGAALRELLHRLRGSAATLGLVDVETAAEALARAVDDGGAHGAVDARAAALADALTATLAGLRRALEPGR